jgi:hypothetical protein
LKSWERTAVGTGEEHLFDVGTNHIQAIESIFVLVNLAVRLIEESTVKRWDELDTALVESQRVAETGDGIVRIGEW